MWAQDADRRVLADLSLQEAQQIREQNYPEPEAEDVAERHNRHGGSGTWLFHVPADRIDELLACSISETALSGVERNLIGGSISLVSFMHYLFLHISCRSCRHVFRMAGLEAALSLPIYKRLYELQRQPWLPLKKTHYAPVIWLRTNSTASYVDILISLFLRHMHA